MYVWSLRGWTSENQTNKKDLTRRMSIDEPTDELLKFRNEFTREELLRVGLVE